MRGGKISNPIGYLLKAFQDDYRISDTEYSKNQKAETESKLLTEKAKQQELNEEKEQRRAFEKWKKELIISKLNQMSKDEVTEQKQDFISKIESSTIFSKMFQNK